MRSFTATLLFAQYLEFHKPKVFFCLRHLAPSLQLNELKKIEDSGFFPWGPAHTASPFYNFPRSPRSMTPYYTSVPLALSVLSFCAKSPFSSPASFDGERCRLVWDRTRSRKLTSTASLAERRNHIPFLPPFLSFPSPHHRRLASQFKCPALSFPSRRAPQIDPFHSHLLRWDPPF